MFPPIQTFIDDCRKDFASIPEARRSQLDLLVEFIRERVEVGRIASLLFICTHNSRRSHMAQIWAQTAATFYGVPRVLSFSGGTQVTAFDDRAVAAMQRAGFRIERSGVQTNPRYRVRFGIELPALEVFSKLVEDSCNPRRDFAAIMTCAAADEACPQVRGAALRVAIPHLDPKDADGTAEETRLYDQRCRQIAIEMLYLFSSVGH